MKRGNDKKAMAEALLMLKNAKIALLCTVNGKKPDARAMLKIKNNGLREIWFSTYSSSQKVKEIKSNPKACVYLFDAKHWKGLKLFGVARVLTDKKSRRKVWRKGFEIYYPGGVDDPNHAALRFIAEKGEFYGNISTVKFKIQGSSR